MIAARSGPSLLSIPVLAFVAAVLTGCAPGLFGPANGSQAVERQAGQTPQDRAVSDRIKSHWAKTELDPDGRLVVMVVDGVAMVTGSAPNRERREDVIDAAGEVDGVNRVINEVRLGPPDSSSAIARDRWIRARLRSRLSLDPGITARNYAIEVSNAVIYLMGHSPTERERDRVLAHARDISYVQRIVESIQVGEDELALQSR